VRRFAWFLGPALLATACGSPALVPGHVSASGEVRSYSADPRSWNRDEIVARSAEVLAEAAADGLTVKRFAAYAAGPDRDPAGTRAMARGALDRLASRKVAAPARETLERIASGRVAPAPAAAPKPIAFPRDEGAHWDALTEWWYLNGHLEGGSERFGFEYTLFRVGPLLFFAHVALTDETGGGFHYAREWHAPGRTASSDEGLDVRYGSQHTRATGPSDYALTGTVGRGAGFDLHLASRKRPMLINGDGTIDMPEGKDSRYYSQTRLDATGTVRVGGRQVAVRGLTWLDHQWGPFYVSGFRERWDWFSVQADDGTDYNLFAFRSADGTPLARYVNRQAADGTFRGARRMDFTRDTWFRSPRTGVRYTTAWSVSLPETGERFAIEAVLPDQELSRLLPFPLDPLPQYWEGRMRATRTDPGGSRVGGVAYAETFGF
jgi:predicted secreted hydrolase